MEFKCYQRNDRIIRTSITYEREPLNLDGCEVLFAVSTGKRCIFSKRIGAGIIVIDETNGVIEINIDSTDTDQVSGRYTYELLITDIDGNRLTAVQGGFEILKSYVKECHDE